MRSFPSVLMDTNNDVHLEIEKKCSLSFQNIMKTLKSKGQIVSDEEHSKAATKLKEQTTLSSVYKMLNPNTQSFRMSSDKKLNTTPVKRKTSKPSTIYNSIIQYNFGKLDIVQSNPITEEKANPSTANRRDIFHAFPLPTDEKQETKPEKAKVREKKSRIAIKEVQVQKSESKTNILSQTDQEIALKSNLDKNSTIQEKTKSEPPKTKFSEGYQLFKMEDEVLNSGDDSIAKQVCDWLDYSPSCVGSKMVSDEEVSETLKQLEEIFNKIVNRYRSTWERQRKEGYLGAKGSHEDLLKLVSVLPVLENHHLEKLINKWEKFCNQIKEHARKNYLVYGAMVSEMQLFLLEFDRDLEKRTVKVDIEDDESSIESYLDTEEALKQPSYIDVNILSDGKPVEYLINKKGLLKMGTNKNNGYTKLGFESGMINPSKIVDFLIGSNSFEENSTNNLNNGSENSIWNAKPFNTGQDSNCFNDTIDTLTNVQVIKEIKEVSEDNIKVVEEKNKENSKSDQCQSKNNLVQKIIEELKEIETHISRHDILSSNVESKTNSPENKSKITVLTSNKFKESLFLNKREGKSQNEMEESKISTNCKTVEVPKMKCHTLPR